MPKKISQLTEVTSAADEDLLELAVVDEDSPTGYSSRSIQVGNLPSPDVGGLPFRYTFDEDLDFDELDNSFILWVSTQEIFDKGESVQSQAIPTGVAPLLLTIDINLAGVGQSAGSYTVPFQGRSTVMLTWVNNSPNHKKYVYNFGASSLASSTLESTATNDLFYTALIHPIDVSQVSDGFFIKFKYVRDYNNFYPYPTRVKFKGYIDITSVLGGSAYYY